MYKTIFELAIFLQLNVVIGSRENWMKFVPDGQKLHGMTIPGTHDSYAIHCAPGGIGCEWARCQNWDVPKQLEMGVRFFDVRLRPFNDLFTIHHGAVYMKRVFGTVLDHFKSFLQRNPSETILVSHCKEI